MKHCDKCNVDVESNLKNCPLCGAYLGQDDGDKSKNIHAYREVMDNSKSLRIIQKLAIFASLIAGIVCLIVDIVSNGELLWSMHLVVALVGFWVIVGIPAIKHLKIKTQIFWDMVLAIAVVFYAEAFAGTNNSWAFLLALPIVFISTLGIYALMMIIDYKRWRNYAMPATFLSFVVLILLGVALGVFKNNPWKWAWYVASGISVLMLMSFFVFGKKGYIEELKMRLHF